MAFFGSEMSILAMSTSVGIAKNIAKTTAVDTPSVRSTWRTAAGCRPSRRKSWHALAPPRPIPGANKVDVAAIGALFSLGRFSLVQGQNSSARKLARVAAN